MRNWLQRVMYGRYGVDQLSWALVILTFALSVLSSITKLSFLRYLEIIPLILAYLRIFSRNIGKRRAENEKFLYTWNRIRRKFQFRKSSASKTKKDRKNYRYYSCPSCHQNLRVPKGKGKISITCPKCNCNFIKKT